MTKFLTAILAAFLLALGVSAQTEQIVWEKDFKKAQALARESGRPLLLDFTAAWCKPCKAMDERFWVLPEVVNMTKPFIAVKVNFDNEKGLVGKYNVSAIPFVIFADPLGNLITFRRGFGEKNAGELNQILKEMPKDFSALKKYYEAVELKKNDGLALLQIADSYRASKMLTLSNDFYEKALKTPEIQGDAEKRERIAATLGLNAYTVKDYRQANKYLEDYLKDFPAGKYREVSFTVLAIGNANLDKMKIADKYLELLKTEFPASKNTAAAVKAVEEAKNKRDK
ncbi:MAG TPA: thioredoxin family protein [Pyrinomonadaceae bacterium]|nr:thioredoxin family protein [Pyrinomonadaceae bacterium]